MLYRALDRTHRFATLAMSLSSLFDISHPTDFLRSALNMLTEYEQAKEENDRPKMVWSPFLSFLTCPLMMGCYTPYVTFSAPVEMAAKTSNWDGRLFLGHA